MKYKDWIPATKAISIGNGIEYRLHKHWAMNIWAGEGLKIHNGDRSGCLFDYIIDGILEICEKPKVVLQRIYYKNGKEISAVLSYPRGITCDDKYLWEIYPAKDSDIERFDNEEEMEEAVKLILQD